MTGQIVRTDTRTALDPDMISMLRDSLRHVLTEDSTTPLADRLASLGWDEVIDTDAATALQMLFEIRGDTRSDADAIGPTLARRYSDLAGGKGEDDEVPAAVALGDNGTVELRDANGTAAVVTVTPETWTALEAHGRWLISAELVGIGRHVIASAVEYTTARVQYGKPIGVFQALQHRLASAHAMVVGAGHLVTEAGLDGDPWTAAVAKCMAGQAAEFACTQAQQCYGAIGFTFEHEFPSYLRRMYSLDWMFGDWRSLEHEIGSQLQATGVVPRIGTL
jgi:alkylation response protein AidB-like acyl-CoA dehydrogenase